jgi:hypothetical protein
VSALWGLKDMPLTYLNISNTRVSDLSALKGMPLAELRCKGIRTRNHSPLEGMPIKTMTVDADKSTVAALGRLIPKLVYVNGRNIRANNR